MKTASEKLETISKMISFINITTQKNLPARQSEFRSELTVLQWADTLLE